MHHTIDFQELLHRLQCRDPRCLCMHGRGDKHTVHCPAHDDRTPSMTLERKGDQVLVHCFGGCTQEAVINELRRRNLWPQPRPARRERRTAYKPQPANTTAKTESKEPDNVSEGGISLMPESDAHAQTQTPTQTKSAGEPQAVGLSVGMVAKEKRLRAALLDDLGLRDMHVLTKPAVRVPYTDREGSEASVRYRLGMTGPHRFSWRKGDKVMPYGLHLPFAKDHGYIVLVEGESDCWTLWQHGLPALGIPGKSTWRPEWAKYLDKLDVYVWQEPHAEDFTARIAADIPGVKVIVAPLREDDSGDTWKDVSEKHIALADEAGSADGTDKGMHEAFTAWFDALRAGATPVAAMAKESADSQRAELRRAAAPVLAHRDPLKLVEEALTGAGYGGDVRTPLITYLAATSRLLAMRNGAMPVHLVLIGPPSSGKSYAVNAALALLPDEAKRVVAAGTPHSVIYDPEPLKHRVLVLGEADSLPSGEDGAAASAMRNLLQDGHLHYDSVVKDGLTGDMTTMSITKEGPTVLITTAIRRLGDQLMTRLFALEVDDTPQQVSAAIRTQAKIELQGAEPPDAALIAFQALLQLGAPWDVFVPFAAKLAEAILGKNPPPRLTRDFARLICLVKAVALIRGRWRKRDEQGRFIAELEDYETVRRLVNDMYVASTSDGGSKQVRETVRVVTELVAQDPNSPVTASRVAEALGISVSAASRRAKAAVAQGWLVNLESRPRQPLKLGPGDPLPEVAGLPDLSGNEPEEAPQPPKYEKVHVPLNNWDGWLAEQGLQVVGGSPYDANGRVNPQVVLARAG